MTTEPEDEASAEDFGGDENFKWWWRPEGAEEPFNGPFDTREEAIRDIDAGCAKAELVEADKMLVDYDVFDGETVIEDVEQRNDECFIENEVCIREPTPGEYKDLELRLASALKAWFDETKLGPNVFSFCTIRQRELIVIAK